MDSEKHNRTVQLLCPTCGATDFECLPEEPESLLKCVGCGRETTRDDLISENSENLEEHKKELIADVKKDIEKDLRDSLRKAFSGSRNIRFK